MKKITSRQHDRHRYINFSTKGTYNNNHLKIKVKEQKQGLTNGLKNTCISR